MRGSGSAILNNHHDQILLSAATQCDGCLFLHLLLLFCSLRFFIIPQNYNKTFPTNSTTPLQAIHSIFPLLHLHLTSIRFPATMSNNPQIQPDLVSPVTSDQHWMRNPRWIKGWISRIVHFTMCAQAAEAVWILTVNTMHPRLVNPVALNRGCVIL